ncbi:hypothetical protein AGABI1DRAFT_115363 [Agaricus bisporus var. burnettii JB137-S8]|uniref:Calcineurin-like phosphoesterase domain-containing protein n=1 Tax=Agaricus bisporus var. burnettii (strain JB137-S8 / ATCC MYA-4627 / FGSC 10392) TaxID=597362 RepID=K5X205_AGABU|nr:uncharacterized protein AGABI1DRAFT_115363 [Agaricus bisporus var. burnettii JB137-S8]EKM77163.1 hypothetical protein AGABI1DRAFT_115363 [Agaricus bisporus var. burnettii JB137-S8]
MVLRPGFFLLFNLLGVLAWPTQFPERTTPSELLDPYPHKPRITFKDDGTLKITVFSDLHFGENPWDVWGPQQDSNSTRVMKRVLKDENPDYAVLNGDLITGENTFRENATRLIDEIVAPLNAARVPFSSAHGNHDNQVNITHAEEIAREQQVAPLSYTRFSAPGVGGEGGAGNYWVPIYKRKSDNAPYLIIWFFDSRGGVTPQNKPAADWVDASVADWIESETKLMDEVWGPGEQRSALAFVHIPPHVMQPVQKTITPEKNPGLNADVLGTGSAQSTSSTSPPAQDTPFWDSANKNIKNIVAFISGHDHGNEWCAREPTKDFVFCFDKHSGYGGYGDSSWGYGVRNIVFHAPGNGKGKPKVESWIRLEEGQTRAHVWLDHTLGH